MKATVDGFDALNKALKALPGRNAKNVMRRSLRAATKPMLKEARRFAPVGESRKLRKSIKVKARKGSKNVFRITLGTVYWKARFIEFGTKPHIIKPKNKKALSSGSELFGKKVNHPGIAANPFIRPAFDAHKNKFADNLGKEVWRNLEKEILKLA